MGHRGSGTNITSVRDWRNDIYYAKYSDISPKKIWNWALWLIYGRDEPHGKKKKLKKGTNEAERRCLKGNGRKDGKSSANGSRDRVWNGGKLYELNGFCLRDFRWRFMEQRGRETKKHLVEVGTVESAIGRCISSISNKWNGIALLHICCSVPSDLKYKVQMLDISGFAISLFAYKSRWMRNYRYQRSEMVLPLSLRETEASLWSPFYCVHENTV